MLIQKNYQIKITTSNLANLLVIKGLFLPYLIKKGNTDGIVLPKKRKRFTLIRSPHVNKKSKEHFQILKYRRLYFVSFCEKQLQDFLLKAPNDVEITFKLCS
jgi:small subunit ribosomal protein S10